MVTQAQIRGLKPFNRSKALIVGVSDYRDDKITDLAYADADARAFKEMLQEETAWKLDAEDIVLLTNEEATYGKFLAELDNIIERAQPKDRIILYFAGHGDVEVVSDDKMGYLLFHDASPTTYATGGACMVNTLDDALSRLVLDKKAEVILITDACRSGTLAGSQNGGPGATAAVISQLFSNTTKILSCGPNELSLEDENLDGGRGIFSYYLIRGLSGEANENNDRYVNLLELELYLIDRVRKATGNQQIPKTDGLRETRLTKLDAPTAPEDPAQLLTDVEPAAIDRDTPLVQKFVAFSEAVEAKRLLSPRGRSAYDIYRSMGESAEAQAFKQVMKISLLSVLQEDAQQALNDYVSAPGRELARRWADADTYDRYPEYLETAATLLGEQSSFYADTKSRAHYFRGVNLRLKAEREGRVDSIYQLALQEQDRALALQPVAPHIYNERGLIFRRLEERERELEAFKTAHALSPRWGLALANLALTYKLTGDLDAAEAHYRKTITLDEELSLSHYNLGVLYEKMGRREEAIECYEKAIACPDPVANAYYNLAELLYSIPLPERQAESAALAAEYARLVPDDEYGRLLLGKIYDKNGELERADSTYRTALVAAPDNFYLLGAIALLDAKRADYAAAIEHWTHFLEIRPDLAQYNYELAIAYANSGEPDNALAALEVLLESGYDNYDALKNGPDLAMLAKNPDFRKLLKRFFPDKD